MYLLVFKMCVCTDFSLIWKGEDITVTASLCCCEMPAGGFVSDLSHGLPRAVSAAALSQIGSKPLQSHGVYKSARQHSILRHGPRNEIFLQRH